MGASTRAPDPFPTANRRYLASHNSRWELASTLIPSQRSKNTFQSILGHSNLVDDELTLVQGVVHRLSSHGCSCRADSSCPWPFYPSSLHSQDFKCMGFNSKNLDSRKQPAPKFSGTSTYLSWHPEPRDVQGDRSRACDRA